VWAELDDHAIETFLPHARDLVLNARLSQMIIFRIGQAVAAVPDEASAFSHHDAQYLFHPISIWTDAADDERLIGANRAFASAMHAYSTGASYLNFTLEADRVRDAYGEEKYTLWVPIMRFGNVDPIAGDDCIGGHSVRAGESMARDSCVGRACARSGATQRAGTRG
jgi:hypothetical protein